MIVAGIGCRRGADAAAILAALDAACVDTGRAPQALATAGFKSNEHGIAAAAALRGLPVIYADDLALATAQPRCVTRSAVALAARGVASVAEAAALAAAGPDARLLAPRVAVGGVTCALAE